MILEIAHFRILDGAQTGFEHAFSQAQRILADMPGYLGHELHRGIEEPTGYRLLVRWHSVADHMDGFRRSPRFADWCALLQPFFAEPPHAAHYEHAAP
ncbi:antibiotic biosynthesis monooxygenase family protein [Burkholderia multivorans]|uniref:antibiotic biosynthesis monooxygenase family protein n=1 Tax=Burkholderia multivorans TaxID=87883 RepID=UPI0009E0CA3D|nr:antibiotic biosynthesis monooxygenase family protein [Burkholderia multivorans]PRE05032.1 antibiotic biosynthesis monooxygenase [Burkholderia multivorans]SAK17995.1 antibiotic biosynthesis monooxygenase [Burkholderia multivorans]